MWSPLELRVDHDKCDAAAAIGEPLLKGATHSQGMTLAWVHGWVHGSPHRGDRVCEQGNVIDIGKAASLPDGSTNGIELCIWCGDSASNVSGSMDHISLPVYQVHRGGLMLYIGWQTCVCSTIYGVLIILELIDQGIMKFRPHLAGRPIGDFGGFQLGVQPCLLISCLTMSPGGFTASLFGTTVARFTQCFHTSQVGKGGIHTVNLWLRLCP